MTSPSLSFSESAVTQFLAADFLISSPAVFGCRLLNWQRHNLVADF
jgi:hypothetical protein